MTTRRKLNGWRMVGTVAVGAVALGAVAGLVGNPGHDPAGYAPGWHGRPAIVNTRTTVPTVPTTVPAPTGTVDVDGRTYVVPVPVAVAAVEARREAADLTRCAASGSIGCHVETDTDGTRSVYGAPVAAATFTAGPAEDSPETVAALAACHAAGFTVCDYHGAGTPGYGTVEAVR